MLHTKLIYLVTFFFALGKYHGPGKGLASRACIWYIYARQGYRISMNFEFFSVEGDPPGTTYK